MTDIDTVREVSNITGVVAAFLLIYRLFDWPWLTYLERGLTLTLLVVVIGQAYGSSRTIAAGTPLRDDVIWAIFIGRILVVVLCLSWPRLRRMIRT